MAITSLSALISGLQPHVPFSKTAMAAPTSSAARGLEVWNVAGMPAAGAFDTTLNGVTFTAPVVGQLPFANPTGGKLAYLARVNLAHFTTPWENGSSVMLCDRIWQNRVGSGTASQAITTPTWPARDQGGTTNGLGLQCYLVSNGATWSIGSTFTVTYTNSAGTAGRTGTNFGAQLASGASNDILPISLQAGDVGIQSIQSFQASNAATNTVMVVYRPIAYMALGKPGSMFFDAPALNFPQMFSGSVPYFVLLDLSTSNNTNFAGHVQYSWG